MSKDIKEIVDNIINKLLDNLENGTEDSWIDSQCGSC